MSISSSWSKVQRIQAVFEEFQQLISERYPDATFAIEVGGEPDSVYLMTSVNLEDTEEVIDAIIDRLLEVQIDEGLPVYVIPIRPTGSKREAAATARVTAPVEVTSI